MNVPIEVVRAGKAEEYVRLKTALADKDDALYKVERALHNRIGGLEKAFEKTFGVYTYTLNELPEVDEYTAWTTALVIEDISKQLTEAAGRLMEARAAYKQAKIDFEKINREVF